MPEKEDDAKRVRDSKKTMIDRKSRHDEKMMLHNELSILGLDSSIWSSSSTGEKSCPETITRHFKGQLQKTKSDDLQTLAEVALSSETEYQTPYTSCAITPKLTWD